MRYLHTMVRVRDLDAALRFFCAGLGLKEIRRSENEAGRYSLIFLATENRPDAPAVELTYNWDQKEPYGGGRNFGHLAYEVEDVYALCEHMRNLGYTVHRPPRDGRMAFLRSPDGVSVELLQKGERLAPREPWVSMQNVGEW